MNLISVLYSLANKFYYIILMEIKTKKKINIETELNTENKFNHLSDTELFSISKNILIDISYKFKLSDSDSLSKLYNNYDKIMNEIQQRNLYEHSFNFIDNLALRYYPDYDNSEFNDMIYSKKEFYIHKQNKLQKMSNKESESLSKKLCDPLFDSVSGKPMSDRSGVMFNLTNSQKFLKTFMSPNTPYRSLLLYHGTGVGKTCTSISIAEQYSEQLKKDGKKIIILLNQGIKENFIKNIFNIQKVKSGMPYYQCTGSDYLKYVPKYESMTFEEIQKQIMKVIKTKYSFYGYQKFANMILNIKNKIFTTFESDIAEDIFKKKIKELFSDTVMIIDEAHNIKEGDGGKVLPPILDMVIQYSENMKLLLLSATPMFDTASEIVWLINLLLKNNKRRPLKQSDYFDSSGAIIKSQIPEFKKHVRGLVSYIRGENPFRFPERLFPEGKDILMPDNMPTKTWDGEVISNDERIKELILVGCKMQGFQQKIYSNMINSTKTFGSFKQSGIMCSNIVYPNIDSNYNNNTSPNGNVNQKNSTIDNFNIGNYIGDTGFNSIIDVKKKDGGITFSIKDNIFLKDRLKEYSCKISKMLEIIKKSEGVVFIYSQFINSGVVPVALALEHMGYSNYGGSLLEKEVKPTKGKYIIISGNNDISKNAYKNYLKLENDNTEGQKIKFIIGSETASEGLDFRYIRSIHILDPWFHLNKLDQIIGRGIRNCSHIELPLEKRNVTVYFYTAINSGPKMNDLESLDISIYREAEKKTRNISEIEYILKTTAVDCGINKYNNIFFNDKDYSRKCNFNKCDFKCDDILTHDIDETKLNYDTVQFETMKDVMDDVIKILKHGNRVTPPLFSTKFIFSLDEIVDYINIDLLSILLGLHKMIITREKIIDKYGRESHIEYKNGVYVVVPKNMNETLFTSSDLKQLPYKKTKKIGISSSVIDYIKDGVKQSNKIIETSTSNTKTKDKTYKVIQQNNRKRSRNNNDKYDILISDIKENSSLEFISGYIQQNYRPPKPKIIYDDESLKEVFIQLRPYWINYLHPSKKQIICEHLIIKYFNNSTDSYENTLLEDLYNILTFDDIYYKDNSFKGNRKQIWGYKIGNFEKKMEYFRYTPENKSFIPATSDEVKQISKSFYKKNVNINFNKLIGFIDIKMPQKNMVFKIRDKRVEGKKGTQIKTGSICNNDGMKKQKIIDYLRFILEDETIYNNLKKTELPSKDLLCLQLETYFRYFDSIDTIRFFCNYEEMIEYKLTQKKIDLL